MKVSQLIKERRQSLNISQEKLAKMLGVGTGQFISNIERGLCPMPKRKLKRVCRCLLLDRKVMYAACLEEAAQSIQKSLGL